MVRIAPFLLLCLSTAAWAEDAPPPMHNAPTRATVSATIVRGEAIGPMVRWDRAASALRTTPDRQMRLLPNDQIRIDFY